MIDGEPAPAGTVVGASIKGTEVASARVYDHGGTPRAVVTIGGDDTTTSEIEGGTNGDSVAFFINGATIVQTATWQEGKLIPLTLTATTSDHNIQVTTMIPAVGPSEGGTFVSITGSNFQDGAVVMIGSLACTDVEVVHAATITCTTPAQAPGVVDVQVTNPNGSAAVLSGAYTYTGTGTWINAHDASGAPGTIISFALSAVNAVDVKAGEITIHVLNSVLQIVRCKNGPLTEGWSVVCNADMPDQVRLSVSGVGHSVNGDGVVAFVEAEVIGTLGQVTPLEVVHAVLHDSNGDPISVETDNGSFTVTSVDYDLAGKVIDAGDNQGLPNTTVTLGNGTESFRSINGPDGTFAFQQVPGGNYVMTPWKDHDTDGIDHFDASLIQRSIVRSIDLNYHAELAADADQDSRIDSFDATLILEYDAGIRDLPLNADERIWIFDPPNIDLPNLNSSRINQKFTGVLLGNVSDYYVETVFQQGTTDEPSVMLPLEAETTANDTAYLFMMHTGTQDTDGFRTTRVVLETPVVPIYSLGLDVAYDADAVQELTVTADSLANNVTLISNTSQPGIFRVSLAGATPITERGALLSLRYRSESPAVFVLMNGDANDHVVIEQRAAPAADQNIYLPLIVR
ncbi:MAG: hypothetical protein HC893_00905 [Chloroflexaceae bacterium]|nr:hypothetical protein [Chloroflexaceae bacterium]